MSLTTRKKGSTNPLRATLTDKTTGRGIDLGTATSVVMVVAPAEPPLGGGFSRACTIVTPASGKVSCAILAGDFLPGLYLIVWDIHWSTGVVEVVPTQGYEELRVEDGLS